MTASKELQESWARTLRHIAASRFYLPEHLPPGEALEVEVRLFEYLHHNELGLALGEAEALGDLIQAPPSFWLELRLAAESMGQLAVAQRYSSRVGT